VGALCATASLAGDAVLAHWTTTRYPALGNYSHFRFSDYGTLTLVGVLGATLAWWVVSRNSTLPQRLFFRLAIAVTLVLWLPDLWLWARGEPGRAVAVLVVMHLVVALVTYNLLVRLAPVRAASVAQDCVTASGPRATVTAPAPDVGASALRHSTWVVMITLVVAEFVLGLVGMLYVPFDRPNGWIAHRGEPLYLSHAILGGALGVAAITLALIVVRSAEALRLERIAAQVGLWGVVVGAIGGGVCYSHSLRLLGMALMFLGVAVAFFGYLIPLIGESSDTTRSGDAQP
jgi:hypothetical protein